MSKKRQIKKNNDVVCAKFETSATNKQKNNDVIFAREHRKFKISVEDFDRKVQKIVTDFNSIYDFWYFCSNLHDSMILKFLLISYPLYWNLTKNILIWRRAFLACVKNPSLNFYFQRSEQRWYYFLGLNTDKMGAKVLVSLLYRKISSWKSRLCQKIGHFHCHREYGHYLYVCNCKQHPFIVPRANHMELHCTCPNIFNFCVEVKYLLNFRAFKICMNKVPESFQEHLAELPGYLGGISLWEPFFTCSPTGRKANIFLIIQKNFVWLGKKSWLVSGYLLEINIMTSNNYVLE